MEDPQTGQWRVNHPRAWRGLRVALPISGLLLLFLLSPWGIPYVEESPLPWLAFVALAGLGLTLLALRVTKVPLKRYLLPAFGLFALGMLLGVTLLAGFLFATFFMNGGDCSSAERAIWTQPGVYETTLARPDWQDVPPPPGFALPSESRWKHASVVSVQFSMSPTFEGTGFLLDFPGRVTYSGAWTNGSKADFRTFVEDISSADAQTIDAWLAALQTSPPLGVSVEPLDRLPKLLENVTAKGQLADTHPYEPRTRIIDGPWALTVHAPVRQMQTPDYVLQVDLFDHVQMIETRPPEYHWDEYRDLAAERMAAQRLPAPQRETIDVQGTIC